MAQEQLMEMQEEPQWLTGMRKEAKELFTLLPPPNLRYGISMNMDLSDFDIAQFARSAEEKSRKKKEAKEDGDGMQERDGKMRMGEEIRGEIQEEIQVIGLDKALTEHSELLKTSLFSTFGWKQNKFTAFHAAYWDSGMVIHIPENTHQLLPLHIADEIHESLCIKNTLIIAEPNSSVVIIENIQGAPQLRSGVVEIIAKENAKVTYLQVQNLSGSSFNLDYKAARLEKNAHVEWVECHLGSTATKNETHTILHGPASSVLHRALFYGSQKQRFDIAATNVHAAPDTQSNMFVRGALDNSAKTIFRGTIQITRQAPRSKGFQKEDVLLLSQSAESDAIPKLEIDHNDVQCKHAATSGQIDDEQLFYLISRGVDEDAARRLIVEGFFTQLLKEIPDDAKAAMQAMLAEKMRECI